MARRLTLQRLLEEILGSKNVYFQPPTSLQLNYPCIIYKLSGVNKKFADNRTFNYKKQYTITLITRDPVSPAIDQLLVFENTSFDRHYVVDKLNHFSYTLYF